MTDSNIVSAAITEELRSRDQVITDLTAAKVQLQIDLAAVQATLAKTQANERTAGEKLSALATDFNAAVVDLDTVKGERDGYLKRIQQMPDQPENAEMAAKLREQEIAALQARLKELGA